MVGISSACYQEGWITPPQIDYRKLNAVTKLDPFPMPRVDDLINGFQEPTTFPHWTSLKVTGRCQGVKREDCLHHPLLQVSILKLCHFCWWVPLVSSREWWTHCLETCPCMWWRIWMTLVQQDMGRPSTPRRRDLKHTYSGKSHCEDKQMSICNVSVTVYRTCCRQRTDQVRWGKGCGSQDFMTPCKKKDVRSFLGLTGYRKFIADYATIAVPLTNLTKKDLSDVVSWIAKEQEAFDSLKKALWGKASTTWTGLQMWVHHTHWCIGCWDWCHPQPDGRGWRRPSGHIFLMEATSSGEKLPEVEKECLAIIALQHLCHRGKVYHSDIPQLPQIYRSCQERRRHSHKTVIRPATVLLIIKYRPGTSNRNTDGLCRRMGLGGGVLRIPLQEDPQDVDHRSGNQACQVGTCELLVDNSCSCIYEFCLLSQTGREAGGAFLERPSSDFVQPVNAVIQCSEVISTVLYTYISLLNYISCHRRIILQSPWHSKYFYILHSILFNLPLSSTTLSTNHHWLALSIKPSPHFVTYFPTTSNITCNSMLG